MRRVLACLLVAGLWFGAAAEGVSAADEWTIVTSTRVTNSPLVLPGLPPFNGNWALGNVALPDADPTASVHFTLARGSAVERWYPQSDLLAPYAITGAVGETGRGRKGIEADHVFRWISDSALDAGADAMNSRVFGGRAGPPAPTSTSFASYGVWIAEEGGNREIGRARMYLPGQEATPLDPSFDNLYRFRSDSDFVIRAWGVGSGDAVMVARVVRNTGGETSAVVAHSAIDGNKICAVSGASGMQFNASDVYVTSVGTVYIRTSQGIWEVCRSEEPIALAARWDNGPLGPMLPSSTDQFNSLSGAFSATSQGRIVFGATLRETSGSSAGGWDFRAYRWRKHTVGACAQG